MTQITQLGCACGQVEVEMRGAPILTAECCCTSCRTASAKIQTLPSAPQILTTYGATAYVLYRKDRIRFIKGEACLKSFYLTPESKTRRVVATCCNTPMFLDFKPGHWLNLYGGLWPAGTLPRLDLRTMVMDLPAGTVLPNDVPNAKSQNFLFFAKLLGAWVAMGFRRPKLGIEGVFQI